MTVLLLFLLALIFKTSRHIFITMVLNIYVDLNSEKQLVNHS